MSARDEIRRHSWQLADDELRRRRAQLVALSPDRASAVAEITHAIATAAADCLLEQAASEPPLRAALAVIYGGDARDEGDASGFSAEPRDRFSLSVQLPPGPPWGCGFDTPASKETRMELRTCT